MADVALRVNGKEFAGWTSARVTRGIECVAGSFDLEVSERWANQDQPWQIAEGDECSVLLGGVVVLTGYVDRRSISFDADSHTLSVSGRDKTGDLVDCSALLSVWEFNKVSVLKFATRVAEPFGISVALASGTTEPERLSKLTIDPGDSAFDAIERACRMAGLLPVSDGAGGLVLMQPNDAWADTALVQGENILSAGADFDASARFARYVVLGQHAGSDEYHGAVAARVRGEARDSDVRRTARVLVVRPEGNATNAHAKRRAEWEAIVRAARGDSVSVVVQGWQQGNGELWPVNALATVRSKALGVDGEMLISQVTYTVDDGGTRTQLTLRRPDAFVPEPVVTKSTTGPTRWKELER